MPSIKKTITNKAEVKLKIYQLANSADAFQVCDSNDVWPALEKGKYDIIAGIGLLKYLPRNAKEAIELASTQNRWIFGYIEYPEEWKQTNNKAGLFIPRIVVYIQHHSDEVCFINNGISDSEFNDWLEKFEHPKIIGDVVNIPDFTFKEVTDKETYIKTVDKIKKDILYGKYYEMNYCMAFKSYLPPTDLLQYMLRLNERTSAPFSAYAKIGKNTILCSSPERFIMRRGNYLLSQPIKGTNKRDIQGNNASQLQALKNSEKERAENVMIVDLVRNDIAHVSIPGTIKVEELFGAYAFKTLNHMISSVSGELEEGIQFSDIMTALFPMGSMTGAPKLEVMKHIDEYEDHHRGIYSGCMGYIEPNGDFDFNVLIRSLVYNHQSKIINYKVGSAITYDSKAEHEYEECLLKGHRLEDVFRA